MRRRKLSEMSSVHRFRKQNCWFYDAIIHHSALSNKSYRVHHKKSSLALPAIIRKYRPILATHVAPSHRVNIFIGALTENPGILRAENHICGRPGHHMAAGVFSGRRWVPAVPARRPRHRHYGPPSAAPPNSGN